MGPRGCCHKRHQADAERPPHGVVEAPDGVGRSPPDGPCRARGLGGTGRGHHGAGVPGTNNSTGAPASDALAPCVMRPTFRARFCFAAAPSCLSIVATRPLRPFRASRASSSWVASSSNVRRKDRGTWLACVWVWPAARGAHRRETVPGRMLASMLRHVRQLWSNLPAKVWCRCPGAPKESADLCFFFVLFAAPRLRPRSRQVKRPNL